MIIGNGQITTYIHHTNIKKKKIKINDFIMTCLLCISLLDHSLKSALGLIGELIDCDPLLLDRHGRLDETNTETTKAI